jgi:hypothetical protein
VDHHVKKQPAGNLDVFHYNKLYLMQL